MKTHVSFETRDLEAAVAFYKVLLQNEPAKHYNDYAFFMSDDPGLELALNRSSRKIVIESTHYGIAVDDSTMVDSALARFKSAGYETEVECEETCCYAKQTKVWTSDPDGRRWEVYAVLEEADVRDGDAAGCCTPKAR